MTTNPRCAAKSSRTGKPCKRYAINGGSMCPTHGGSAPNVKEAAKRRLLEALDPAAAELARIATKGESEAVRVKAITEIMDRAGLPAVRREEVSGELSVAEEARGLLRRLFGDPKNNEDDRKEEGGS